MIQNNLLLRAFSGLIFGHAFSSDFFNLWKKFRVRLKCQTMSSSSQTIFQRTFSSPYDGTQTRMNNVVVVVAAADESNQSCPVCADEGRNGAIFFATNKFNKLGVLCKLY